MKNRFLLIALVLFVSLLMSSCSRNAPEITAPPIVEIIYISLNEAFTQGVAGDPDWIELYNSASEQKDVSGYKLYDSAGKNGAKPKMTLPAGSVIPAFGLLVVVVNDTTASAFDLAGGGHEVWLEDASGKVLESVAIPALEPTQSYGKTVEGAKDWKVWNQPTRGLGNNGSDVVILPMKMNEVFSRGVAGNLDWVEIYNPSNIALDLTGYRIYDGGGNSGAKPKMLFPAGSRAPAKGFFVITVDDTSKAGFGLSSSGDDIWFENAEGTVIDNIKIPAMPIETTSYCRIPDGAATWQISNTVTKGAANKP